MRFDNEAASTALMPKRPISSRFSGTSTPRPPSRIAIDDRLAKPHSENVVTAIVRAGRDGAMPTLERLAAGDSDVAKDAADYLDGLRRGLRDMDALWEHKRQREIALPLLL